MSTQQTIKPEEEMSTEAQQLRGLRNLQRDVGEVAMLMAGHPTYKGLFLTDLRRAVMPAVLYNQYRIIRNNQDRIIGFISWATVSQAVHKRLMSGQLKLQMLDWNSGDMAVVMDVVAPTIVAGEQILTELKTTLFTDSDLWVVQPNAGAHEPKLALYKPHHTQKNTLQ